MLNYIAPTKAFQKIGAERNNGAPYAGVRGISVSSSGRHFRFWEADVLFQSERTLEIYRQPGASRSGWMDKSQGRKFFAALKDAANANSLIYGVVNQRGANGEGGHWQAKTSAPILTHDGKPAPGRVVFVDTDSGELRIQFSLLGDTRQRPVIDQFHFVDAEVERTTTATSTFSRNTAVRYAVLDRSKGHCEFCDQPGFETERGVYLETHHVISLASNGDDSTLNVVALCALCHKKAHHAKDKSKIASALLAKIAKMSKVASV